MTRVGDRVELVRCSDPYTKLEPGSLGTVSHVDDAGTVHVNWDSGSNLGLIAGEDAWKVVQGIRTLEDIQRAGSLAAEDVLNASDAEVSHDA